MRHSIHTVETFMQEQRNNLNKFHKFLIQKRNYAVNAIALPLVYTLIVQLSYSAFSLSFAIPMGILQFYYAMTDLANSTFVFRSNHFREACVHYVTNSVIIAWCLVISTGLIGNGLIMAGVAQSKFALTLSNFFKLGMLCSRTGLTTLAHALRDTIESGKLRNVSRFLSENIIVIAASSFLLGLNAMPSPHIFAVPAAVLFSGISIYYLFDIVAQYFNFRRHVAAQTHSDDTKEQALVDLNMDGNQACTVSRQPLPVNSSAGRSSGEDVDLDASQNTSNTASLLKTKYSFKSTFINFNVHFFSFSSWAGVLLTSMQCLPNISKASASLQHLIRNVSAANTLSLTQSPAIYAAPALTVISEIIRSVLYKKEEFKPSAHAHSLQTPPPPADGQSAAYRSSQLQADRGLGQAASYGNSSQQRTASSGTQRTNKAVIGVETSTVGLSS